MSLIVSDTTPLNYLILIGHVDILPEIFGKLLIPPAVIRELSHPKTPQNVSEWVKHLPAWVEVKAPTVDLHLDIGAGEDEAISLALELGNAALLVDDRKARAAADERGIVTFGTIALLDVADEAGLLDFEDAAARLLKTTFRVEASLLSGFIEKARARKRR